MSLRSRLERLEQQAASPAATVPPLLWEWWAAVTCHQPFDPAADAACRAFVRAGLPPGFSVRQLEGAVEARIEAALNGQPANGQPRCGLVELEPNQRGETP